MKVKCLTACLILSGLFVSANSSYACTNPPVPILTADMDYAVIVDSITVTYDGSYSYDTDGTIVKYEWDFHYDEEQGFDTDYTEEATDYPDGAFDGITTYTYNSIGDYAVKLRVTDNASNTAYSPTSTVPVTDTIQSAIDLAEAGDVVVAGLGTYTGSGNRDIDFGGSAITVRSTDPTNPDVVAATIINCQGSSASNHRGFWFHNSESAASVLNGFTIKNGYHTNGGGAGIKCQYASPTITNCVIVYNEVHNGVSDYVHGGGIFSIGGSPTITNCIIMYNRAYNEVPSNNAYGSGIACINGTPTITNCTIVSNSSGNYGGGMYCEGLSSATTIADCTFRNNSAGLGGGICNQSSSHNVTDCIFSGNVATYKGGGMYNRSGSEPTVVNCVFSENAAVGDGIEYGGRGGGIANYESSPELINCTLSGNSAKIGGTDYGYGGGMWNYGTESAPSDPIVTNCIFWGNSAEGWGNEIYNEGDYANPTVTYCCVQVSGYLPYPGEGNIKDDPEFVKDIEGYDYDPEGQDGIFGTWDDGLALCFNSPCIDAGNNSAIQGVDEDIVGKARVVDGDHDLEGSVAATVDMGAYELPRIWFVDNYRPGGGNGYSWNTAFSNLQSALDVASSGDEIWVAYGISSYKPSERTDPLDPRSATFQLSTDIELYGGFRGRRDDEVARCQRDRTTYETTLSGNIGYPEYQYDNSYHVVTGADDAILDGFTITAGNASGQYSPECDGGGMYNLGSSPIVSNCIFRNNSAGYGGGMWNWGCHPKITNCVFHLNSVTWHGGGMANQNNVNGTLTPTLTDCTFIHNSAGRYGGGMQNYCSGPTLINCAFIGNEADEFGGGIWNYFCKDYVNNPDDYTVVTLTNCIFSGNSAGHVWVGPTSGGGGGGGIENYTSDPKLTNCTFSRNHADDGYGGGMYSWFLYAGTNSIPSVTNCIFWENEDMEGQGESSQITGGSPIINYSCIQNWSGDFGGLGNIGGNPKFMDADGADNVVGTEDDNLRLLPSSPCIDAGDNTAINQPTDIAGNTRKVDDPRTTDTGNGNLPIVDMGAYEFPRLKITGGENHTLLIRGDSTVWACGANGNCYETYYYYGALGIGSSSCGLIETTIVKVYDVDMVKGIKEIDTGWYHSLAVDVDGFVWAWGGNDYGQVGDGTSATNRTIPVGVKGGEMGTMRLENIMKVAAGRSGKYSLACDGNRYVWAWGQNDAGQLGNGKNWEDYYPEKACEPEPDQVVGESGVGVLENIIDIDAGILHSIALEGSPDRYVWCWGDNSVGQLGNNSYQRSPSPVQVLSGEQDPEHENTPLEDIVDVAVTANDYGTSYAVEAINGYVWAWGDNRVGQLGQGNTDGTSKIPVGVLSGEQDPAHEDTPLKDIVAISAGLAHALALDKDGNVWAWGYNEFGQLGNGGYGDGAKETTPVRVKKGVDSPLTNIVYVDAGWLYSTAIDENGNFWVWGDNYTGQLGLGYASGDPEPYAVQMP